MIQFFKDWLYGRPEFSWSLTAAGTGAADAALDLTWLTVTSAISAAIAAVYAGAKIQENRKTT